VGYGQTGGITSQRGRAGKPPAKKKFCGKIAFRYRLARLPGTTQKIGCARNAKRRRDIPALGIVSDAII
jgi:hypothetical protein